MSDRVEEFLEHHGVLGMKWGVRKDRSRVTKGSLRKAKVPKGSHPDYRNTHLKNRKKVNQLSNKDIKAITARLEMEKKLVQLRKETSPSAQGRAHVKSVLGMTGAGAIGVAGTAITVYNMLHSNAGRAFIKTGGDWVKRAKFAAGVTKAIAR